MALNRTELEGPCDCMCHDHPGTLHFMACCHYTHQPRAEAESLTALLRTSNSKIILKKNATGN